MVDIRGAFEFNDVADYHGMLSLNDYVVPNLRMWSLLQGPINLPFEIIDLASNFLG